MEITRENTELTQLELINVFGGEVPMSRAQANEYGSSISSSFRAICDFCSDFVSGFGGGYNDARR